VTIIFAVTKDQIPIYRELSKLIEGSTVGELANDSSNIVELVKENYDVCIFLISLSGKPSSLENTTADYVQSSAKVLELQGRRRGDHLPVIGR